MTVDGWVSLATLALAIGTLLVSIGRWTRDRERKATPLPDLRSLEQRMAVLDEWARREHEQMWQAINRNTTLLETLRRRLDRADEG